MSKPMTFADAETCLQLTLRALNLNAKDSDLLEKAMRTYAGLVAAAPELCAQLKDAKVTLEEAAKVLARDFPSLANNIVNQCAIRCGDTLSAWEKYRPDDLTDDELAEYVIQSKGILVP